MNSEILISKPNQQLALTLTFHGIFVRKPAYFSMFFFRRHQDLSFQWVFYYYYLSGAFLLVASMTGQLHALELISISGVQKTWGIS